MAYIETNPSEEKKEELAQGAAERFVRVVTPAEKKLGSRFYPEWNEDAHYLGEKVGGNIDHGSALLAHLSPQTEAELNRVQAFQLANLSPTQQKHLRKAKDYLDNAAFHSKQALVATKAEDPVKAAFHTEEAAKSKLQAQAHRGYAEIGGTPLAMQNTFRLGNAAHAIVSDDPMSSLGNAKIWDFGNGIRDLDYPVQTIDTQYHDYLLGGRTDIVYADGARGLENPNRMNALRDVADRSHKIALGMDSSVPSRSNEFMAGAWTHQQVLKSRSANGRNAADSRNLKLRGSEFDPANEGRRPIRILSEEEAFRQ